VVVIGAGRIHRRAIARRLADQGVAAIALAAPGSSCSCRMRADRLEALLHPTDAVVMVAARAALQDAADDVDNVRMMSAVCVALRAGAAAHESMSAPTPSTMTPQRC